MQGGGGSWLPFYPSLERWNSWDTPQTWESCSQDDSHNVTNVLQGCLDNAKTENEELEFKQGSCGGVGSGKGRTWPDITFTKGFSTFHASPNEVTSEGHRETVMGQNEVPSPASNLCDVIGPDSLRHTINSSIL